MTTTIAVQNYRVESPLYGPATSIFTGYVSFSVVRSLLSDRPLERPQRLRPIRELTNRELKQLAETHRPPQEWFEGETESPF